ncbi:MAG: type II toxin-antitoxin system RelE/ParE family toxin [Mesorhizobium sp.]|nr:type II toxin-antitoxin system RelE/ParE family toxin [bacterium M00.F.Ca.ET.205.01.1.1]TGU52450.1 type II toxin-antitoxin system RelE/ParE family toxin [bacterium M00.F.Ca.ET.152.01.1.1]TGV34874.1 type II toxin-antitoxin system RelE/ParE family toxin [Mesorhizobium sp. M00.F.Ca.ET.186.01.1.1]TGZ42827.1 type II toxin-antitoxin system RelE/ParE family toxin [bacterium M00.F.Ca.ET.162.01.1.1]TJW33163.1 MAG: type II toxin-antitoxin system RelE/ParE family toxin [Mesorhizobium sp.]
MGRTIFLARYRLTPRAAQDLRDSWRTIAIDNEKAADKLLMRIFDKLDLAAQHPRMGTARAELSATVRVLIEGRYVVICEPQLDGVLVVAIVHGMRDPEHWL